MTHNIYTSYEEAVQREVIDPIQASGEVKEAWLIFDVSAIANEAIGVVYGEMGFPAGYALQVGHDEFWGIVADHELPMQ